MGKTVWSDTFFREVQAKRAATGADAFVHTRDMQNAEAGERHCHPAMDLRLKPLRESRDSEQFPESLAISVFFDETRSMGTVPRALQKHLDKLMGALLRNGVTGSQVMIGAVGDAGCGEIAPVQVGEWETDIKVDTCLGQLFLEDRGGGNYKEDYELVIYAMARHTDIDCWNKRQHKGYVYIIGDEMPYDYVDRYLVEKYIGGKLEDDIPLHQIVAEVQKRFELFFVMPQGLGCYDSGYYREVEKRWIGIVGAERFIKLHDVTKVSERIAESVAMLERAKREGVTENLEADRRKRRSRVTPL